MGRFCYPTQAPGRVQVPRLGRAQKTVTVQARPTERRQSFGRGGYGTCFCRHGTNFIEHYACRGTSFIGVANLSPVTKYVERTDAVSRYKLSRRQKFITVQNFN